jgi:hypothetical protein
VAHLKCVWKLVFLVALPLPLSATLLSLGAVTYNGIDGSATASTTIYLGSASKVNLSADFAGGTANFPSCPKGIACTSHVDAQFSIAPANLHAMGGATYSQSSDPADPGIYNFIPIAGSAIGLTQLTPGIYTAVVTLSSSGSGATVSALNIVSFEGDFETANVSDTPEPATLILGAAALLCIAVRQHLVEAFHV